MADRPIARIRNGLQLDGRVETPDTTEVTVITKHPLGVLFAVGTTVPTDTEAGYVKGCLFIDGNASAGSILWLNEGDASSCDFNVLESAASSITGIVGGEYIMGDATEGTATLEVALPFYNGTGGELTAGTLVRVAGFDTTLGVTVVKADSDTNTKATHVVVSDTANTSVGAIAPLATLSGFDTSLLTIGNLLYLSATAGEYATSAPVGPDKVSQVVGIVKTVHATTGTIVFLPGFDHVLKFGSSFLQPDSVTKTQINGDVVGDGLVQDADGAIAHGATIYNDTGSALTAGSLVYLNSYSGVNGLTVELADADANIPATHIVVDEIANGASGNIYEHAVVDGLATNGQTIGDAVYLDATTPGAFVFAAPSGADQVVQKVGTVKVVDAAVGEIEFFPAVADVQRIGSSYLQPQAVTGGKVTNSAVGVVAHTDLAAIEVDLDAASPFEILASSAVMERLALVTLVATEAAAGNPDLDIGVASDANSVVDDFGSGAWAVGDRLTRLIRIPAGDNLRATITAAGTAGKVDVYIHLLAPAIQTANIANSAVSPAKASADLKTDLVTAALMGTLASASFPLNVTVETEQAVGYASVEDVSDTFYSLQGSTGGAGYSANYQLFPDTEVENDAAYFGGAAPFGVLVMDMSQAAIYGADSLAWEYWNGAAWSALTIVWDETDTTANDGLRSFQADGAIIFSAPADWASTTVNGQAGFFVRARCSATVNITQVPTTNSVEHKLVSSPTATEMPAAGTIGRGRFSWVTVSGANNDTIVILCNLTKGTCSALKTLTQALQVHEVADFSVLCDADDQIALYVTQEDGTTEFANGILELNVVKS
mgnify:CR=1 FL=1